MKKPIILHEGTYAIDDVQAIRSGNPIWRENDIFEKQLEELFIILFPALRLSDEYAVKLHEFVQEKKAKGGSWVYFPWNGHLIHMVNEEDYTSLRTNRNKNLITSDEQHVLLSSCVGIAGLSIGSAIALNLSYSGIGNSMKLADMDNLETCNLNRVHAGVHEIGETKLNKAVQDIYEINPFSQLETYENGLTKETLAAFLSGGVNVVFDEIDDFEMKVLMRMEARNAKIPVMMMTNLGDSILVDVERYDVDPTTPLFNGLIGDTPEQILQNPITEKDKIKYAMQIVGIDAIPTRALGSLLEINKTLAGRPQLNSTVVASAGIASYLVRRLLLKKSLPSGRKRITLDELFAFEKETDENERNEIVAKLQPLL
jgi:molybdopterin/thiamine biosynthesis adenylyltransferase